MDYVEMLINSCLVFDLSCPCLIASSSCALSFFPIREDRLPNPQTWRPRTLFFPEGLTDLGLDRLRRTIVRIEMSYHRFALAGVFVSSIEGCSRCCFGSCFLLKPYKKAA